MTYTCSHQAAYLSGPQGLRLSQGASRPVDRVIQH